MLVGYFKEPTWQEDSDLLNLQLGDHCRFFNMSGDRGLTINPIPPSIARHG
jgi:hypothetical protein